MDKRTILAFLLIGLVLIIYSSSFYQERILGREPSPTTFQESPASQPEPVSPPSLITSPEKDQTTAGFQEPSPVQTQKIATLPIQGQKQGLPQDVIIETNLYRGVLSTQGGVVKSWRLKKYQGVTEKWVELIPTLAGEEALTLVVPTEQGIIDLSTVLFEVEKTELVLQNNQEGEIRFHFHSDQGWEVEKIYRFANNQYGFEVQVRFGGVPRTQDWGSQYEIRWEPGLQVTEPNPSEDIRYEKALAMLGRDLEKFTIGDKPDTTKYSGDLLWGAVRSKYFVAAIMPQTIVRQGVQLEGRPQPLVGTTKQKWHQMRLAIKRPLSWGEEQTFTVYIGPIDYNLLRVYERNLEEIVDLGWRPIRPFALVMLWFFIWTHRWIENYGVVIILFSILVKTILFPLTKKSTKAMRGMQQIQPQITALKEKYKNDAQRLNREMMVLYKKHGVNPLGGCLPMVFQIPIFFALYTLLRSTIELRQADFVLWINDLSAKDPHYIMPLIMGITMFFQNRMTMKDPKQKIMVYAMPVVFTFMLKDFPSGLTLYWTMFNLLSIAQQLLLNKEPAKEAVTLTNTRTQRRKP